MGARGVRGPSQSGGPNLGAFFVGNIGPPVSIGSILVSWAFIGPSGAVRQDEGICLRVSVLFGSRTGHAQSFTFVRAIVIVSPRRCIRGSGPLICPFRAIVVGSRPHRTLIDGATFISCSKVESFAAIRAFVLVLRGRVRPRGAIVGLLGMVRVVVSEIARAELPGPVRPRRLCTRAMRIGCSTLGFEKLGIVVGDGASVLEVPNGHCLWALRVGIVPVVGVRKEA